MGQMRSAEASEMNTAAFAGALALGYEEVLTNAALHVSMLAFRVHQNERALEWARLAESANERTKDPEISVLIENARGNVARNQGNFVEAARYYGNAVQSAQARLGADHMTSLGVRYNHASALQNLGQFGEAAKEFEVVIEASRRTLGPKHPFLSFPLVGSANVAMFKGQSAAAKANFEEVLAITGGKGVNTDNAYDGLSDLALEEKRYDDAFALLAKAHALHVASDPSGADALVSHAKEGLLQLAVGKRREAMAIFDDVLARGAKLPDAFDAVAIAQRGKARLMLELKQPEKALSLAEAAVATLTRTRSKIHPLTLDARLLVAESKRALRKTAEATADAQSVLADVRLELGDDHPLAKRAKASIAGEEGRSDIVP